LEKLRAGTSQNRQEDQTESDDPIQASTFGQGVPRLPAIAEFVLAMGDGYYASH
jgi:hypothetical protein